MSVEPETTPLGQRRVRLLLAGILVFGFLFKLLVAHVAFFPTFDSATPGLMALGILEGERPLFFYGQSYMGALEAYLAAVWFKMLGPGVLQLSLSAITFSMGWVLASFLLFRELFNERAGLAAAVITAVPGWATLWFNIATYGGYPAALFFGTMSLWLCVLLARRELCDSRKAVAILGLGLCAGLGMWTHYLTASYLIGGFPLFLYFLWHNRRRPLVWISLVAAGILFLAAVSPVLLSFGKGGGAPETSLDFSIALFRRSFRALIFHALPDAIDYRAGHSGLFRQIRLLAEVTLVPAFLGYLYLCVRGPRRQLVWSLVPVFYLACFFTVYFCHSMSKLGASRYLIPALNIFACAAFAAPSGFRWKGIGRIMPLLPLLVVGFHLVTLPPHLRDYARGKHRDFKFVMETIETARSNGLASVTLLGGDIFGYRSQIYSFMAGKNPIFSADCLERHQASAQRSETEMNYAYLMPESLERFAVKSLDSLNVSARFEPIRKNVLIHRFDWQPLNRVAISPSEYTVTDLFDGRMVSELGDRQRQTMATGDYGKNMGLKVDLGRVRTLNSLWLLSDGPHKLGIPKGWKVEGSLDGTNFFWIASAQVSHNVAYTKGPKVFMGGFHGLKEIRFDPAELRWLRLNFVRKNKDVPRWRVTELFLFEHQDGGPSFAEYETAAVQIAERLKSHGASFAYADRWMSARLLELGVPAFARINPKAPETIVSRQVEPSPDRVIVVDRSVLESSVSVLEFYFGPGVVTTRELIGPYAIIFLAPASILPERDNIPIWNGHCVMGASPEDRKIHL